jgi:siderophore synthetase component
MQELELLGRVAPEFEEGFKAAAPQARVSIATKLAEALWREDIGDARRRFKAYVRGNVLAFDRVELAPVEADPLSLVDHPGLRAELASAMTGLALAYARREAQDAERRAAGARDMVELATRSNVDEACVLLEQLATEGHNLHPCGRTRLGWDIEDLLAHDLETPGTKVGLVEVPGEKMIGEIGAFGPGVIPVHAWQLRHLLKAHPDWGLRVLDDLLPARPTAALRTLLVAGHYLKVSLDIQVTSTRRTISIASTRNGPLLSELLASFMESDRVLLMPEIAGAASTLGDGRQLSAIVRTGLAGRREPPEVAVPAIALPATDPITGQTVLSGLVARSGLDPQAWLVEYANLLLPMVLRLAARHGIGLEAHLQNCVPTFVEGRPHRIGLRDFGGLRVYAQPGVELWPGSVIVTADREVMLAKVAYTAFQAHLGEIVLRLGLDETAWRLVRQIVDAVLEGHPDHAFYTAETLPHKALTRMRLDGRGDVYVPVRNPLHG